jgi:hypothetical protein
MTAELSPESPQSLDQCVTRVTQMLLAARGQRQQDLAPILGITPAAISGRVMGHTAWRVLEVEKMAAHFKVPPELFLRDPGDLIGKAFGGPVTVTFPSLSIAASNPNPARTDPRRGHIRAVPS